MLDMENVRIYGKPPYSVAVIHGGPGAPGSMAPVANGLKDELEVLEPLQSADSVMGQAEELYEQLKNYEPPFVLIGHSWGAWLAWIFAAYHPGMVKHLILVGSGPFDDNYAAGMMETRLNNLDAADREAAQILLGIMKNRKLNEEEFASFGSLMSKSDSYCEIESPYGESPLPAQPHIFESVWPEAATLRKSGELLQMADKIECKITVIHGKQDPHPYKGIRDVFAERGVGFEFILLERCGHTPWKEKYCYSVFFHKLKETLKANQNQL